MSHRGARRALAAALAASIPATARPVAPLTAPATALVATLGQTHDRLVAIDSTKECVANVEGLVGRHEAEGAADQEADRPWQSCLVAPR